MQAIYRELPARRRFGVELEVTNTVSKHDIGNSLRQYEKTKSIQHDVVVTPGSRGWAETRNNAYWHVKYDSTCGPKGKGKDFGWEIASYIGQGYRDMRDISSAADWLAKFGLQVNHNCGLHIHIEAADISIGQMGVLLARWVKIEPVLIQICQPHRAENRYCCSLRERWMQRQWLLYNSCNPSDFWSIIGPSAYYIHNNPEKKYTLNTVGYALGKHSPKHDRQTIELRLPECLLDASHVSNWLHLMLNLVEVCKKEREGPDNMDYPVSVAEFISLLGLHQENGVFVFLDQKLLDTKLWLLHKIAYSSKIHEIYTEEAADLLEFISTF